ncbi:hypothetical protein ACVWZD_005670 [Streptomyces sp. TE3672]
MHRNKERWAEAVRDERAQGVAVCDTGPLKLHYAWTFVRAGLDATADAFTRLTLVRDSLQRKALGIADLVACVVPSESALRTHRSGDTTGTCRNFETHVHLAALLKEWYEALNDVDPGRVVWKWPEEPLLGKRRERYGLDLFDAWTGVDHLTVVSSPTAPSRSPAGSIGSIPAHCISVNGTSRNWPGGRLLPAHAEVVEVRSPLLGDMALSDARGWIGREGQWCGD